MPRAVPIVLAIAWSALGCTQFLDVGGGRDGEQREIDGGRDGRDGALADAGRDGGLDGGWLDGGLDGGRRDGGRDGGLDGTVGPSCASDPVLAVALRSVHAGTPSVIARFAMGERGVARCEDVRASGALPILNGIGWIDRDRLVVANGGGLALVDVARDRVIAQRFFVEPNHRVIDVFGLREGGEAWGAVAIDLRPGAAIDRFYLVRASDATMRVLEHEEVDTRRLTTCDASPTDPARALCVENLEQQPPYGTEAAAKEVLPFTGGPAAPWVAAVSGSTFLRIDALGERIVWITRTGGVDGVRESIGGLRGRAGSPTRCASALCADPGELVDVAVDPTRPDGYFAVCRGAERFDPPLHVLRGRTGTDGEPCEVVLDGHTLPSAVDPIAIDTRGGP